MPFIHITSLPYEKPFNVTEVITNVGRDFAEQNGLPLQHVHTTWEFFQPGYYAKGDRAPKFQPDNVHSVLVDLLTPDFNDTQTVEKMLKSIATSLSDHANIPTNKVFINHRQAKSGMVFDDGQIVYW